MMSEEDKKIKGERVNIRGSLLVGDGYEKGKLILYSPFLKKVVQTFDEFHNTEIYRLLYFSENHIPYMGFSAPDRGIWIFDMLKYSLYKIGSHNSYSQGLDHIEIPSIGGRLASCGMDNCVRIWDVGKRKCLHVFNNHSNSARQVHFLDERTLFSSSYPNELNKYDLEKLVCVTTVKHDYFWDFALHTDRNLLVGAGYGNDMNPLNQGSRKVTCISLKNLSEVVHSLGPVDQKAIYPVCVASNGDVLVGTNVSKDNVIRQWDDRTFKLKNEFVINNNNNNNNNHNNDSFTNELLLRQQQSEGGIKGICDVPEKRAFSTCIKGSLVQTWDYENNKKVINYDVPYQCYGLDYIPFVNNNNFSHRLSSKSNDQEITHLLSTSDELFSDVKVLGLSLWTSIFQKSGEELEKRVFQSDIVNNNNISFDEVDEKSILEYLFLNNNLFISKNNNNNNDDDDDDIITTSKSQKSAKFLFQHYEFFKSLDMVYGMKRVIAEVMEIRDSLTLLEIIEQASPEVIISSFDHWSKFSAAAADNNNLFSSSSSSSALVYESLNSLKKIIEYSSSLWKLEYNRFNHQKEIIEYVKQSYILRPYHKHSDFSPIINVVDQKEEDQDDETEPEYFYKRYDNNSQEFKFFISQLQEDRLSNNKFTNIFLEASTEKNVSLSPLLSPEEEEEEENNYYNNMTTKLNNSTTTTTTTNTRLFECHKEILVLRSEFFLRLFRFGGSEMQEFYDTGKIIIQLLDARTLEYYLDYLYFQDLKYSNYYDDKRFIEEEIMKKRRRRRRRRRRRKKKEEEEEKKTSILGGRFSGFNHFFGYFTSFGGGSNNKMEKEEEEEEIDDDDDDDAQPPNPKKRKIEFGVNEKENKFQYLEVILNLLFFSDMFGEVELQNTCTSRFLDIWCGSRSKKTEIISKEYFLMMSIWDCRWWVLRFGKRIRENANIMSIIYPIILTRLEPEDSVITSIFS